MPQASASAPPVLFSSDASFREWSSAFPTGFVLDLRANLSPEYIMLHKPTCRHIAYPYHHGASTERGYRKVGALTVAELAGWISANLPDARCITAACKSCAPAHDEADLIVSAIGVALFDTTADEDVRTRVLRSIVERRGQSRFRSSLVEAYSAKCAISGCEA
jgi:hypothetical protein